MKELLAVSKGLKPADLVVTNGKIVNVFSNGMVPLQGLTGIDPAELGIKEKVRGIIMKQLCEQFEGEALKAAVKENIDILIVDEVLAVGDMAFQKKCLTKMRSAAKQDGRTVLYVSHNMNTIRQLCDRCIVLEKGKVAFIALAKAYFAGGGQQYTVTVVSPEDLLDALENPDRHRDLIVRVGGYSGRFVELSKELQDNVIARTSLEV